MAEKDMALVDISPDSLVGKKTKIKKSASIEEEEEEEEAEEEDEVSDRAVLCLKSRHDLKRYEETEDCFILDFDPFETFDISKLSFSDDLPGNHGADDLSIIHEKGQVACRDYPHPRHLCLKFPFETTPHSTHCPLCYCCVCDLAAPCELWNGVIRHCDASEHIQSWKLRRETRKLEDSSNHKDSATCNLFPWQHL